MQTKQQIKKTLASESGMTLIELIVYMAILSLFMMGGLFILGSGNEFAKESKEHLAVQNEFRLASISIKSALKRYDYVDGFNLEPADKSIASKGDKLSFKQEGNSNVEEMYIYFDTATKKLMEHRAATPAHPKVEDNIICELDLCTIEMDKLKKTVTIHLSYGKLKKNLDYKEVFNYKTNKH